MQRGRPLARLSPADLDTLARSTSPTLSLAPKYKCQNATDHEYPPVARPSRRACASAKISERPPLISRRMRRVANDKALRVAAENIDALPSSRADLRALFERQTRTAFTTLLEDPDAASAWESFVNMDEDVQRTLIPPHTFPKCSMTNLDRLNKVDRKIRLLFKTRSAVVRPLVKQVEDTVVDLAYGESVVLSLRDALSRMVAHGVAQFHSLAHQSLGIGCERVLVICGKGHISQGSARLLDVLA